MKVLLLSENFPPVKGGSAVWLENLYRRIREHDVQVAAGECSGHDEYDREFEGTIERVRMTMSDRDPLSPSSWGTYLRIFARVAWTSWRASVNQVHCGKVLPEGFVALALKWTLGLPYVVFCHGEEVTTTFTSRRYRFLVPLIYRQASIVIANASNTERLLKDIGVAEERIRVLKPSVEADQFRERADLAQRIRAQHGLGDGPVLVTVGRLQLRKGHDVVIRAMNRILDSFPGTRYLIAGDGEERARLEDLVRREGLEENVVFAGLVPDEDLPGYYAAADVFLMPNRDVGADFEGFGIVFLEAAAAGKPVIGGNSGGAREAVVDGETGLLVDGSRVEEVAAAVLRLLGSPDEAERLARAAEERVRTEFSYPGAAARLEEIIAGAARPAPEVSVPEPSSAEPSSAEPAAPRRPGPWVRSGKRPGERV